VWHLEVILNKAVIEYREHLLLFIDRGFEGRDILFLKTGRLPYYPYLYRLWSEKQYHLYAFAQEAFDDPVIRMFLEVMDMAE